MRVENSPSNFEAAKHRGVMETLVPEYGYSKNEYEDSNEKRLNELHKNKESLAYDTAIPQAPFSGLILRQGR